MNKTYLYLLLLAVVIAGCTKGGEDEQGRFIGGDVGLEISFVPEEPPLEVLDDNEEPFDITVLLRNFGEVSVGEGEAIVTLHGIDQSAFSLSSLSAKNEDELERRQRIADQITVPEETEVRFRGAKYIYDLDAALENDIRADVCYQYSTLAVTDLCLKKKAIERRTRDQCDINNDAVEVDNSGAPVKVQNIVQRSSGSDEIKFTFDIVKVGAGDVFDPQTFTNECISNEDTREFEDNVHVTISSRGDLPISCSRLNDGTEGTVELVSGTRSIRCDVGTSSLQEIAFLRRINIKLDYFYKDSTTTFVRVIDLEENN